MTVEFQPHPDCPDWRMLADDEGEAAIRSMGDAVRRDAEERPEKWSKGFSRRQVLAGGLGMGVAALGAQLITSRVSYAQAAGAGAAAEGAAGGRTLVVVFLRGGMDGLSVLVPADDPKLLTWRPDIAVRAGNLMRMDSRFGLHPALGALKPMIDRGRVAAVPDISTPVLTRSHFQAQDCLERGGTGSGETRGWLDRVLEQAGAGTTFRSLSATSNLTRSLTGVTKSVVARNPGEFQFRSPEDLKQRTRDALEALYTGVEHPVALHARIALDVDAQAATVAAAQNARPDPYPKGGFGQELRLLSTLIQEEMGVRVATVDIGGWDMHTGVGNVDKGDMKKMLTELGDGLAAFFTDLGDKADSTTVILMSEFGRRVDQNGSGGVDHGHGGLAIALGAGVRGGVYGDWRGLDESVLADKDLPGVNDFRDFLSEIVQGTVGLSAAQTSTVFDGWKAKPLGLISPVAA